MNNNKSVNLEGIFAVNKPVGMTSHDVVNILRRKTGIKRIGHGGTLDPLAEGVLVIGIGRENTRQLEQYVKGEKEYIAQVQLGENSTTGDEEGNKETVNKNIKPLKEDIEKTITLFCGEISQTPPKYSSVKINGIPAHRRTRRGQEVIMEPRKVYIKDIKILHYEYPLLTLQVITGPGVYIRSLAQDIGEELGTGAYLKGLQRTRVANFTLENALEIENKK